MTWFRFVAISIVQTLLRMLPFPCRTGLRTIGSPNRDSPVLLTGNFQLTVARVERALAGIDAYLLVANSRGVNVWCAATGGLLSNHDVVSVLKTSGIDRRVDHRHVILPQLAATGIERSVIETQTGWRILWGPVEAQSIPSFLNNSRRTTAAMRQVTFPWRERLEMAVAWAFPISLLALVVAPFWPGALTPIAALVWGSSLLMYLAFPLYEGQLQASGDKHGVVSAIAERAPPLAVWALFVLLFAAGAGFAGELSIASIARWGVVSLVVFMLIGIDLMGSTPVYKSGLHSDRWLRITLDESRCRGAGFCEQVCPTAVFEMDSDRRVVTLPNSPRCVQCGACVVQCPFDALFFESPGGDVIAPETLRRTKLNLLGQRSVRTSGS